MAFDSQSTIDANFAASLSPTSSSAPSVPTVSSASSNGVQQPTNISSSIGNSALANNPGAGALTAAATPPSKSETDLRIRLSALNTQNVPAPQVVGSNTPSAGGNNPVYGAQGPTNIMSPLYGTNGMLFPYTPTITYSQNIDYKSFELVHTNQDWYAYTRTPSLELTISGDFTIQNQIEGQYALACVHFLRTVSKMYYGSGANLGLPPPMLQLNGYGTYMFNKLPVILKNFSVTLDKTVDYINVSVSGGQAPMPSLFQINVSIIVQNTPAKQRTFDLDKFRTGALMQAGGWI